MILPQISDHPYRSIFKRAGVSLYQVAKCLGIQYPRAWAILAGRSEPNDEQNTKLQELIRQIEVDAGAVKSKAVKP